MADIGDDAPTVTRKRDRRRVDPSPQTPEEYAYAAVDSAELRTDGRMMALPCVRCGGFPGDCVDHPYTEPPEVFAEWAEPVMLQANPLPILDSDQFVVGPDQVWVKAYLNDGTVTTVLRYNPGDIISVAEAIRLGLLGGTPAAPQRLAEAMGEQRPQVPMPTAIDASSVEAPGRGYLPGVSL